MAKTPTKKANPESGMEPGPDTEAVRGKVQAQFDKADKAGEPLTPKERRAVENEAFEKAPPEEQAALANEAEVGKQVRGY